MVYKQITFIETTDLGYTKDSIITVGIPDRNPTVVDRFRAALLEDSRIEHVSFGSITPGESSWWVDVADNDIEVDTEVKNIDHSFLETYDLKLLAGRNYLQTESFNNIIVNQELLREFGIHDEISGIGKSLRLFGEDVTVVGVVKDFHSDPLYENIRPCVLVNLPQWYRIAGIKYKMLFRKDKKYRVQLDEIIAFIKNEWEQTFPNNIFEYHFFDEKIAQYYKDEKKLAQLINIFTIITIIICCLGIVGLAFHFMERKRKEIAIRKVNGASVNHIFFLLTKNFTRLVLVANLFAWPIAWYATNKWLQNFAYRINIEWLTFALAGMLSLVIALLAIGYQTIRATYANPVNVLRYE